MAHRTYSHGADSHVQDVSAEALCADFHKPLPSKRVSEGKQQLRPPKPDPSTIGDLAAAMAAHVAVDGWIVVEQCVMEFLSGHRTRGRLLVLPHTRPVPLRLPPERAGEVSRR